MGIRDVEISAELLKDQRNLSPMVRRWRSEGLSLKEVLQPYLDQVHELSPGREQDSWIYSAAVIGSVWAAQELG